MRSRVFTIVELLVVVAVIGILAAVGVMTYSTQQKKAREARRISDIGAIADAIQQEISMNQSVPAAATESNVSTVLTALVTDGLLAQIPNEPLTGASAQGTSDRCQYYMYSAPTTSAINAASSLGQRQYALSFHSEVNQGSSTAAVTHSMNSNFTSLKNFNVSDANCQYTSFYLFGPK